MARRERTTALPRRRERDLAHSGRTVAGISWDQDKSRWAIIGGAVALLLLVIGLLGWNQYHERFIKPNETILRVGEQKVSLGYYADRLRPWLNDNLSSGLSTALLEQSLLTKLEDEALALLIAADRGITITDDDVTNAIAEEMGVPPGGSGSSFDNLYRDRLKSTGMSDGNYRRLVRAQLAETRVKEQIAAEIGDTGELVTLRTVVVNSEEKANDLKSRIEGGEDMGTIAQTESLDLTSRQIDGLMQPDPIALMPENVRNEAQDRAEGELVGPVQVQNNWWVFRIEKRDPGASYSQTHKDGLTDQEFDRLREEKRRNTPITRSLDSDDIAWAEDHA